MDLPIKILEDLDVGREYAVTSVRRTTRHRVILTIEKKFVLILRSSASKVMLSEKRRFYTQMRNYAECSRLKIVYYGYDRFDFRYGFFDGKYLSRIMKAY